MFRGDSASRGDSAGRGAVLVWCQIETKMDLF